MKKILQSLFLIGFIFLISGCSQKATPTIEYIKEEKYPFQFINLEGVYIDLPKEQQMCNSKLQELDYLYLGVRKYYEDQILDYMGDNK